MTDNAINPDIQSESTDLRSRIIDAARDLFLDHGYSKVSTNEIAQSLGISKKTLYKEFENKEEILRAVLIPKLKRSALEIDTLIADVSLSFIEKLKAVMSIIGNQHKRASSVLMKDIYVHAP